MSQKYTICISCGKVQYKTDVVDNIGTKIYVLSKNKVMCPKCHKEIQVMETKDINKVKMILLRSPNQIEKKLGNNIG